MAQTVIDQLIVKLGLDPRDFTKGVKEAAAAEVELQETTKKTGGQMSRELSSLATKWLSLAAAIKLIKGGINIIDEVATRTRKLAIDAKNMDQGAAAMRNWENAVEDAGGTSEEARKSIGGLNRALFDLAYNGQVSDSLVMLARLGVQFQDASGKARNFQDVALDTADAIATAQAQGMTRSNAFQFLQQAGFDAGTAQLLLSGRANVEASLPQQAGRRQVSGEDIQKATDISRARIGKEQALEGAKIGGMNFAGSVQEEVNRFIEKLASPGGVNAALDDLGQSATKLGDKFDEWLSKLSGQTIGMRNNNPLNLKGNAERNNVDRFGHRVFPTMAEGIKAADHQLDLYAQRGINTIDSIVNTWTPVGKNNENYKALLEKTVGKGRKEVLGDADRALLMAGMARFESGGGNAPTPDAGTIADMLQQLSPAQEEALFAPATPSAQGGQTYNKTDVQIDNITVSTQAKDADTMAGDMDGAIKRKLMAAHGEQGMQ